MYIRCRPPYIMPRVDNNTPMTLTVLTFTPGLRPRPLPVVRTGPGPLSHQHKAIVALVGGD